MNDMYRDKNIRAKIKGASQSINFRCYRKAHELSLYKHKDQKPLYSVHFHKLLNSKFQNEIPAAQSEI